MKNKKLGNKFIDKLKNKVENRYILSIIAAKRARHIQSYINAQKYMRKTKYPKPLIETNSTNPLTIAFKEIANGKISYKKPEEKK